MAVKTEKDLGIEVAQLGKRVEEQNHLLNQLQAAKNSALIELEKSQAAQAEVEAALEQALLQVSSARGEATAANDLLEGARTAEATALAEKEAAKAEVARLTDLFAGSSSAPSS
jgi:hypothetical protein